MARMANAEQLPPPVEGSCRWLLQLLRECFSEPEHEREHEPAQDAPIDTPPDAGLAAAFSLLQLRPHGHEPAPGTSRDAPPEQQPEEADAGWRSPVRLHALLARRHNVTVPLPRLMAALNTGVARRVLDTQGDLYRLAQVRQQPQPQRQREEGEARRQQPRRRRGQRRRGRQWRPKRWRRRNRHLPCVICRAVHVANICEVAPAAAAADADGQCSICFDDVRPERGRGRAVLRCGHGFHYKCATRWARTRRDCPMCRRPM